MKNRNIEKILEALKKPCFAVVLMGFVSATIIFTFRDFGVADFFIVTVLAFLFSDATSILLFSGGKGIMQIRLFGTKTQPKGYGFLAFFISILLIAVVINVITMKTIQVLSVAFSDFIADFIIGLILAGLVYLDVYAKFFVRSKTM